ncbi:MAG: hypothetical protein GVY09_06480 [Gammaproteobacteria bacterium]|nr:hypothetical protein [Gammaproteobacteria bacterium]
MQNKNTRAAHQYGEVRGGGENKVNVLCFKDGSNAVGFNLHIQPQCMVDVVEHAYGSWGEE